MIGQWHRRWNASMSHVCWRYPVVRVFQCHLHYHDYTYLVPSRSNISRVVNHYLPVCYVQRNMYTIAADCKLISFEKLQSIAMWSFQMPFPSKTIVFHSVLVKMWSFQMPFFSKTIVFHSVLVKLWQLNNSTWVRPLTNWLAAAP